MKIYSENGLYRSVDIFNYPHEYPVRTRLLGFRFFLQFGYRIPSVAPGKEKIIKQMKELVDKYYTLGTLEANSFLMEIVDIMTEFFPEEGEKLLMYLREKRLVANENGPSVQDGPECTVYGDSQSVHNKEISKSVKAVASYLVKNYAKKFSDSPEGKLDKYQHYNEVKESLISRFGKELEPVIDRIYIDNANFGIGHTVDEVLMAVLNWIKSETGRYKKEGRIFPDKEVIERIGEELREMDNYCSSGLLSRIVNSIQGFTDGNENLNIKISEREQVKSVIYNHLNRTIQANGDENLLISMTDKSDLFINFVKTEVADNIVKWVKEYGKNFVLHVTDVVNEYTSVMIYE